MGRKANTLGDFWKYVLKGDGCWEWQGNRVKEGGYGRFRYGGKTNLTHRLSYEMHTGPIPEGLMVLHTCDNPGCVRPDHLYIGTAKDNADDREERDRSQTGDFHYTRREPERAARGERINTARLTEDKVRIIRERYDAGGVTQTELAQEYGVTQRAIWMIVRRKSWRHVSEVEE
jgi:hypothetical protein